MAEVKRWTVTYTKHTKQKRKVYQDGFLELQTSTNKVMLYDDSEKLLECRLLKKDEVVSSGESLTFSAYLIDIFDAEGDHKPISDLNSQGRDKKITGNPGLMHGQKIRNRSVSLDRENYVEKKSKAWPTLSPSHKIIREFKKGELHKYQAPQTSPDTTKLSTTEWQVLYTIQVTQKTKKYHDGFLQLATCGSLGRQVMLFDASRKLLNSRFLKKDEVVRSGESITFDAHLVEIGEPDGDSKPLIDLNAQGNNCNVVKETRTLHGQENCVNLSKPIGKDSDFKKSELDKYGALESSPDMAKPNLTEWHALYTSQITQKAKKYHSGILKVTFCGSFRTQVTLLNEDKAILSSKFLSLSEDVRTGSLLELPKYLVDVGEPCVSPEGALQNNACSEKEGDSNFSISSVNETKLSRRVPTKKPLRDARQILSILQKPTAQESIAAGYMDNSTMELVSSTKGPQVSDAVILDSPENGRPPRVSLQHRESSKSVGTGKSSENIDIGNSPGLMSCEALSSELSKGVDLGNSHQPGLDKIEADTQWRDGTFAFGKSSSIASASHGPIDNVRKTSTEHTCTREIDEGPSFDLGF